MEDKKTIKRRHKGIITSVAMDSTAMVTVTRSIRHPKYGKDYKVSKKYPSDTGGKEFAIGDAVVIEECRPLSKTKRYRIVK